MKDNKQSTNPRDCRKPYVAPASESIRFFAEGALLTGTNEYVGSDDEKSNSGGGSPDFSELSTGRNRENPIWKNMTP